MKQVVTSIIVIIYHIFNEPVAELCIWLECKHKDNLRRKKKRNSWHGFGNGNRFSCLKKTTSQLTKLTHALCKSEQKVV